MTKKLEIVDARGEDYVVFPGKLLRNLMRNKIGILNDELTRLMSRMNNEIPTKEAAVALMVTVAGDMKGANEAALFMKASIERALYLEGEIKALNVLAQCFYDDETPYHITVAQAQRYGLS
jgi:hypothetical protein